MNHRESDVYSLKKDWCENPRWQGVRRDYSAEDVIRLRGSLLIDYTLARCGADKLWRTLQTEPDLQMRGALTGQQAIEQIKSGFQAIYLSGSHLTSSVDILGTPMFDSTLYPAHAVSSLVRRINSALLRCDQLQWASGKQPTDEGCFDFMAPIIADAEAGQGGVLNAFELMKSMIEVGASGVVFEDKFASAKGLAYGDQAVLIPSREAINKLIAARLAADVAGVPTLLVARTDADTADLISSDIEPSDHEFLTGERTAQGYFRSRAGVDQSIQRGLAYAPYADMLWCEAGEPDLKSARKFADAIHRRYPGKLLAYNCALSVQQKNDFDGAKVIKFQRELSAMGYQIQFVSLAGLQVSNQISAARQVGRMRHHKSAFAVYQQKQLASRETRQTVAAPPPEVRLAYFDVVARTIEASQVLSARQAQL